MKQTIVILTALMAALLLITGFVTAENVQQNQLMADQNRVLEKQLADLAALEKTQERLLTEAEHSAQTIRNVTEERDALSLQLNDAVLASQEANDAAALQEQKALRLTEENQHLQLLCTELEDQLAAQQEEAAWAALMHEQETAENAQRMEQLQLELEQSLAPTPAPSAAPVRTPVFRHIMVTAP